MRVPRILRVNYDHQPGRKEGVFERLTSGLGAQTPLVAVSDQNWMLVAVVIILVSIVITIEHRN
jgi:hypothetical protein